MSVPVIGEHYVKMPQEIWDQAIDLTKGEFRLLGYLLRHQARAKNTKILLTQDELLNGRKKADGSRMDKGCGLSSGNHIREARKRLEDRGWLKTTQETANSPIVYEALYRTEDDENSEQVQKAPEQVLFDGCKTGTTSGAFCTPLQVQKAPANKGIVDPVEAVKEKQDQEVLFDLSSEQEKTKKDSGPTREEITRYCEDIYGLYPRKVAKREAVTAIEKAMRRLVNGENPGELKDLDDAYEWLFLRTQAYAKSRKDQDEKFTPHPATWFNGGRYLDQQVKLV